MSFEVPFNKATFFGGEDRNIAKALSSGQVGGDGPFTQLCQSLLEHELGAERVFLTTSCTHSLEMAAILLGVQPGDEVIVPSFTFVSTANAFVARGAVPVFSDVRADTLNLDEELLEGRITGRTRAIVAVHYAGIACEMRQISGICDQHQIDLIEDNAHGLFGRYEGRALGTVGRLGTLSFHETKNFSCGEGGALIVNDSELVERAEIIREKGTNRARFFRGEVDKYTWVDEGSSYLPSDILAGVLLAQLEQHKVIQEKRQNLWETYQKHLSGWASQFSVQLPVVPQNCESAYHMYHMLLRSRQDRDGLIHHLRERRLQAVFHYVPLHLSDMGRRFGGRPGLCPVTEDVADRTVRLPFYNSLSGSDQKRVIEGVLAFRPS